MFRRFVKDWFPTLALAMLGASAWLVFSVLQASAADGAAVSSSIRSDRRSGMFLLCDSKVAADAGTDCADLTPRGEPPRAVIVSVAEDTGCAAFSVILRQRPTTDGDGSDIVTFTNGGTTHHTITTAPSATLYATLTTLTGCTDFDLTVEYIPNAP